MQTQQVIQASANVIRINKVSPGDVYKRFEEGYENRTIFGVIKMVHNDGEKAIIEAVEYTKSWGEINIAFKIMHGTKDYIIFPSSPEELGLELEEVKKAKIKEIEKAEEEIIKNNKMLKELNGLITGETQKNLKSMSYKESTQVEYEKKKAELMS